MVGVTAVDATVSYAERDRLFVPVQQLALVSRYAAGEGARPALHRLGSGAWQKTKARAQRAIQDMAEGLIRAYAARRALRGLPDGGINMACEAVDRHVADGRGA